MLSLLTDTIPDLNPARLPAEQVQGLYIHIPFCFHKCHYCDFYSITRQTPQRMSQFVDRLLREAQQWRETKGPVPRPRTVFIGGGTPTLLPMSDMQKLLRDLKKYVDFSAVDEWTVEANPATVNLEYCEALASAGVNRLSFGAQSFDLRELKTLERHHHPDDVASTIETARNAGFQRLNIDLIYAIPGQSFESWTQSLDAAVALGTTHLSCYGLTYESNTPITVRKRLGEFTAAEETLELQMLRHTRARLTQAGMPAYEISNYAAPGKECRHNLMYWTGGNYIGLGPSAASHVSGWRWKNRPHLGEWEAAIDTGVLPASEVEHLTPPRRAAERVMLQLRLTRGIDFSEYADQTGYDARTVFSDVLSRLSKVDLLEVDNTGFRLTDRGLPVADAIASEFLNAVLSPS